MRRGGRRKRRRRRPDWVGGSLWAFVLLTHILVEGVGSEERHPSAGRERRRLKESEVRSPLLTMGGREGEAGSKQQQTPQAERLRERGPQDGRSSAHSPTEFHPRAPSPSLSWLLHSHRRLRSRRCGASWEGNGKAAALLPDRNSLGEFRQAGLGKKADPSFFPSAVISSCSRLKDAFGALVCG